MARQVSKSQDKRHVMKNGFITSPRSEEILDIIRQYKGTMPLTKIYVKVKYIDPKVPSYTVFCKFINNMEYAKQRKTRTLVADMQSEIKERGEESHQEFINTLLDSSYQNLFAMGDVVIKQEMTEMRQSISEGKALTENQKERVMDWFFKGARAHNERRVIDLKTKEGDREQRLVDNLLDALQYQKIDKDDIVDGKIVEENAKN